MTNADKFKSIFGLSATELWVMRAKDFIAWLNADAELFGISEQLGCSDCVTHGGDWECDHVHCRKGMDTISRAAAINAICEDGTRLERQGKYTMTMAERKQRDADILDALPFAKPVAKDINVPAKDCISRQAAIDALENTKEVAR